MLCSNLIWQGGLVLGLPLHPPCCIAWQRSDRSPAPFLCFAEQAHCNPKMVTGGNLGRYPKFFTSNFSRGDLNTFCMKWEPQSRGSHGQSHHGQPRVGRSSFLKPRCLSDFKIHYQCFEFTKHCKLAINQPALSQPVHILRSVPTVTASVIPRDLVERSLA